MTDRQRDMFDEDEPEHDLEALARLAGDRITRCASCSGNMKIYRHPLGVTARVLIDMLPAEPDEWVHVPSLKIDGYLLRGGDYAKLRHFGLIEPHPTRPPEESGVKSSGMWRLTPHGRRWTRNTTLAPSHYFNRVPGGFICVDGRNLISIVEALAKKFDYYALMRGDA